MKPKKIFVPIVVLIFVIPLICQDMNAGLKKENLEKGKKIFEKVIEAMGGPGKINKIKNVYFKIEMLRIISPTKSTTLNVETIYEYPDKYWYSAALGDQTVVMILDGDQGWLKSPPKNTFIAMKEENLKYIKPMISRDPFCIFLYPDRYNIQFTGEKELTGKTVLDLFITGPTEFHMLVDPKTYLPVGYTYKEEIPQISTGLAEEEETWHDYKKVDDITMPFKIVLKIDGKKSAEAHIKEIKFNIKTGENFYKAR